MKDLKINVEAVVDTADKLKLFNNQMRDGFPSLQNAVTRLDGKWDGAAAVAAISKFNEMKSKFLDERYDVLNNYVNFLLQQVGQGYSQTEETNKSLAERFK